MRVALYARVSSKGQADARTIQSQLRALRLFVTARGWSPAGEYIDDGRSAKSGVLAARDGFARLARDAAAGRFQVVAVFDLDRLTRSEAPGERGQILDLFHRNGIAIACVASGQVIDVRTSEGDMMSTFQAFAAADWLRKHRERTLAGKARAVAEGRKPGGPTPFGYTWSKAAGFAPHPERAPIVRELYERVARGSSYRELDRDLIARGVTSPRGGQWREGQARKIVASPTYRGSWTVSRRRALHLAVPRLVSDDLWYAAQATIARVGKAHRKRAKGIYLLEGLAVCALCGAKVGVRSHGLRPDGAPRSPTTYACAQRSRPDRGRQPCTLPHYVADRLDGEVWSLVERYATQTDLIEEALARRRARSAADARTWEADLGAAKGRLARLVRSEGVVLDRFRRGLLSETALDTELGQLAKERHLADMQVAAAERAGRGSRQEAASAADVRAALSAVRGEMSAPSERQRFVRLILGVAPILLGPASLRAMVTIPSHRSSEDNMLQNGSDTEASNIVTFPVRLRLAR